MYKLLKVIFVVLLVVTVIEVGYYIYILNLPALSSKATTASKTQTSKSDINEDQILTEQKKIEEFTDPLVKNISESTLTSYRQRFGVHDNENIFLTLEQPGIIKTLFTKQGSTIMVITNEQGEKIIGFTLNDQMKFYKLVDGNHIAISNSDIKEGDKIIIRLTYDILTKKDDMIFIITSN